MKNYEETTEMTEVEATEVKEKKKLSTRTKVALGVGGGILAGIILSVLFGGKKHKDEESDTIELSEEDYEVNE